MNIALHPKVSLHALPRPRACGALQRDDPYDQQLNGDSLGLFSGDLAFDGSCPAVRAAVAEGLGYLVDNPLAQPILKAILPQLGPLLFDVALTVRTSIMDLLLQLRYPSNSLFGKLMSTCYVQGSNY